MNIRIQILCSAKDHSIVQNSQFLVIKYNKNFLYIYNKSFLLSKKNQAIFLIIPFNMFIG